MRYEKSLKFPASYLSVQTISPSRLREGEEFEGVRLGHMREKSGEFVCAEGETAPIYAIPQRSVMLFGSTLPKNAIFMYEYMDLKLVNLQTMERLSKIPDLPEFVLPYVEGDNCIWYVGTPEGIAVATKYSTTTYDREYRTTSGAMHRDRLFFIYGYRLFYTRALGMASLTNSEGDLDGAGYIDLYSENGKLVRVISFRDRLYLFRERGVAEVRAEGEALEFKVQELPYGCGKVVPESIALCGDRIAFLTEEGFFTFDGTKYTRCVVPELRDCSAASWGQALYLKGTYYYINNKLNGTLFAYDFATARGRFIQCYANCIAATDELYFQRAEFVYRLTEQGAPYEGMCTLDFTVQRKGGALERVEILGEGDFTVTAEVQGKTYALHAGELPVLFRGEKHKIRVEAQGQDFVIRGVKLVWRQYEN